MSVDEIPTIDVLEEIDRAVLAALMAGQIRPGRIEGYVWTTQDARDVAAAMTWLYRHRRGHAVVAQVVRIDGQIVDRESVAAHPGRARVEVGLEVPHLVTALAETGCTAPDRVKAWATRILREYRTAVAPDLEAARAPRVAFDAETAFEDLRAARRAGDRTAYRTAWSRILEVLR